MSIWLLLKSKHLVGKFPSKLYRFFHGKQDRALMRGSLGGGDFARHKEASIIAEVFMDITELCFLPRQPNEITALVGSRSKMASGVRVKRISLPVTGHVEMMRAVRPSTVGNASASAAHHV